MMMKAVGGTRGLVGWQRDRRWVRAEPHAGTIPANFTGPPGLAFVPTRRGNNRNTGSRWLGREVSPARNSKRGWRHGAEPRDPCTIRAGAAGLRGPALGWPEARLGAARAGAALRVLRERCVQPAGRQGEPQLPHAPPAGPRAGGPASPAGAARRPVAAARQPAPVRAQGGAAATKCDPPVRIGRRLISLQSARRHHWTSGHPKCATSLATSLSS